MRGYLLIAAEITARTRWRLIHQIDPQDVIFYATDGVFLWPLVWTLP